jgi:hemoglobin-like flavoprotein
MDQNELARIFNDSYERVVNAPGETGGFFVAFYNHLIATSPEAASKFRDTDMEKQVRMLHASVAILLAFYGSDGQGDYLRKLAERHSKRGTDITPRLYQIWLTCLIETARQFDPKFDDDVATAWRAVFSKGIEFMASRYEEG